MNTLFRYMPCSEFELAVNAHVDGELAQSDSKGLLVHLELCDGCRGAIDQVRAGVRMHRGSEDLQSLTTGFDKDDFFSRLSGRLLESNLDRLANLLYELGKAYFLAGNDSKLVTFIQRKAVSIERAAGEGKRLVKETLDIAGGAGATPRRTAESLKRTRQMFRGREDTASTRRASRIGSVARMGHMGKSGARSGRPPLDNARRYLEECLILNPAHAAARIYLGVYFQRVDRPDEAIAEYRKNLALPGLDKTLRVMTMQALGNAHAYRREYPKAIEVFEEIRALGHVESDPKFFTILLSLAMFYGKTGQLDRSTKVFGELVSKFPTKTAEARKTLEQAEVFRSLLHSQTRFRIELAKRYPVLFAG